MSASHQADVRLAPGGVPYCYIVCYPVSVQPGYMAVQQGYMVVQQGYMVVQQGYIEVHQGYMAWVVCVGWGGWGGVG